MSSWASQVHDFHQPVCHRLPWLHRCSSLAPCTSVIRVICTWKLAWTLQIMIFIFPAFTLSPFSSIASFQIKSLLTHSLSDSAMITMSLVYRSSQGTPEWNKASSTMMKQWAEYWALMNNDLHFKLFIVPLTNTDTAQRIGIHPVDQSQNPLLHTKFSQHSLDDLLQVYKSHVQSLVGS